MAFHESLVEAVERLRLGYYPSRWMCGVAEPPTVKWRNPAPLPFSDDDLRPFIKEADSSARAMARAYAAAFEKAMARQAFVADGGSVSEILRIEAMLGVTFE